LDANFGAWLLRRQICQALEEQQYKYFTCSELLHIVAIFSLTGETDIQPLLQKGGQVT
jgi:hypothetical protein